MSTKQIDGEDVVASYKCSAIALAFFAFFASGMTYAMSGLMLGAQEHRFASETWPLAVLLSALMLLSLRNSSHPAIFLTQTRALYRPAWGRLEIVAYKDIKRMWLTRVNITSIVDRTPKIFDGLSVLTNEGKIYVWPLTFRNTGDLYSRLTKTTNIQVEDHTKNDLGHFAFGKDLNNL